MAAPTTTTTHEPEPAAPDGAGAALAGQDAWSVAWRQLRRNGLAMGALVVLALMAGVAVFAPLLANGRPLFLRGHLTNVYESDLAAFEDWHARLRDVVLLLRADVPQVERDALEARRALYVDGLPRILRRLGDAVGAEREAKLEPMADEYRRLIAAPPASLDLEAHAKAGRAIVDLTGGLSLGAAYAQASQPLLAIDDWLEAVADARVASTSEQVTEAARREAAATLERLGAEGEAMATRVDRGVASVLGFLRGEHREALGDDTVQALLALRGARDPAWEPRAARAAVKKLTNKLDQLATYPVDPGQQLLPRVVQWPAFEYLGPADVGVMTLYVALLAALLGRRMLAGLGPRARVAAVVGPALAAGLGWWALVPPGLPPADALYKEFARSLLTTPDDESLVVFPPVPFGENENIYQDRVTPPVLWELRAPEAPAPGEPAAPGSLERRLREPGEPPLDRSTAEARLGRLRSHWLGTDDNGRDITARLIMGSRVSLSVGFVAVSIFVTIGVFFGSLAGYFGGWVDVALSRVAEVVTCMPTFFLIITVMAMLDPSIWNIMIVLGLTRWVEVFRLVRAEFLRLRGLDFVTAARALGFSDGRVVFRHVLPNALGPVFVAATFGVAGAILTESALSFLGFGVPQPDASWGSVLQGARGHEKQMWWITVFPGLLIFITITAYNLLGEGLRDALDPRLRR